MRKLGIHPMNNIHENIILSVNGLIKYKNRLSEYYDNITKGETIQEDLISLHIKERKAQSYLYERYDISYIETMLSYHTHPARLLEKKLSDVYESGKRILSTYHECIDILEMIYKHLDK